MATKSRRSPSSRALDDADGAGGSLFPSKTQSRGPQTTPASTPPTSKPPSGSHSLRRRAKSRRRPPALNSDLISPESAVGAAIVSPGPVSFLYTMGRHQRSRTEPAETVASTTSGSRRPMSTRAAQFQQQLLRRDAELGRLHLELAEREWDARRAEARAQQMEEAAKEARHDAEMLVRGFLSLLDDSHDGGSPDSTAASSPSSARPHTSLWGSVNQALSSFGRSSRWGRASPAPPVPLHVPPVVHGALGGGRSRGLFHRLSHDAGGGAADVEDDSPPREAADRSRRGSAPVDSRATSPEPAPVGVVVFEGAVEVATDPGSFRWRSHHAVLLLEETEAISTSLFGGTAVPHHSGWDDIRAMRCVLASASDRTAALQPARANRMALVPGQFVSRAVDPARAGGQAMWSASRLHATTGAVEEQRYYRCRTPRDRDAWLQAIERCRRWLAGGLDTPHGQAWVRRCAETTRQIHSAASRFNYGWALNGALQMPMTIPLSAARQVREQSWEGTRSSWAQLARDLPRDRIILRSRVPDAIPSSDALVENNDGLIVEEEEEVRLGAEGELARSLQGDVVGVPRLLSVLTRTVLRVGRLSGQLFAEAEGLACVLALMAYAGRTASGGDVYDALQDVLVKPDFAVLCPLTLEDHPPLLTVDDREVPDDPADEIPFLADSGRGRPSTDGDAHVSTAGWSSAEDFFVPTTGPRAASPLASGNRRPASTSVDAAREPAASARVRTTADNGGGFHHTMFSSPLAPAHWEDPRQRALDRDSGRQPGLFARVTSVSTFKLVNAEGGEEAPQSTRRSGHSHHRGGVDSQALAGRRPLWACLAVRLTRSFSWLGGSLIAHGDARINVYGRIMGEEIDGDALVHEAYAAWSGKNAEASHATAGSAGEGDLGPHSRGSTPPPHSSTDTAGVAGARRRRRRSFVGALLSPARRVVGGGRDED